jgi:hypothetical protein
LKISLPTFEYLKPDPTLLPAPATITLAKITLQYLPCESSVSVPTPALAADACISAASSSYPAMNSDLQAGQDTGYLHYLVTLENLSSTTATFQITDSSVLTTLQNKVNAIAADIHTILGT